MQTVELQELKVVILLPQLQRFLRVMRFLREKLSLASGGKQKNGAKVKQGIRRTGQKGHAYS